MKLGLAPVNSGKNAKRTPHSLAILLAPWQSEVPRLGPVIVDGPASLGLRLSARSDWEGRYRHY